MHHKKPWILSICLGLLCMLGSAAVAQDMSNKDLNGINPENHKYLITSLGGAALGAGLGFLLGGGLKTGKLALIGGGGASAWFLHTHRDTLGGFHDWAMVASGTALGTGIGWTICDCNNGLIAGTLIGGGGTAVWEAMKHDSAARNAFDKATGSKDSSQDKKTRKDTSQAEKR